MGVWEKHLENMEASAMRDGSIIIETMNVTAKVRNGRLTIDEPTDLPEGTEVELTEADPFGHLDEEELERLNEALRRGREQNDAGLGIPAADVIAELRQQQ